MNYSRFLLAEAPQKIGSLRHWQVLSREHGCERNTASVARTNEYKYEGAWRATVFIASEVKTNKCMQNIGLMRENRCARQNYLCFPAEGSESKKTSAIIKDRKTGTHFF